MLPPFVFLCHMSHLFVANTSKCWLPRILLPGLRCFQSVLTSFLWAILGKYSKNHLWDNSHPHLINGQGLYWILFHNKVSEYRDGYVNQVPRVRHHRKLCYWSDFCNLDSKKIILIAKVSFWLEWYNFISSDNLRGLFRKSFNR